MLDPVPLYAYFVRMRPRNYPGVVSMLVGVIPALLVPLLAALVYFVYARDSAVARWVYGGAKVFLVLWPALWWAVVRPPRSMRRRRGMIWWRVILEGLASGLILAGAVWLAMLSPLGEWVYASTERIQERTQHLGVMGRYIQFALAISLVHSFIEEYFWRWFVFGRLRVLLTRWFAAVISSAGFAAHHVVVTSQFFNLPMGLVCGGGVFVAGLVWAALYVRHGYLLGAWLSHLVVDLAVFAVGWQILRSAGAL